MNPNLPQILEDKILIPNLISTLYQSESAPDTTDTIKPLCADTYVLEGMNYEYIAQPNETPLILQVVLSRVKNRSELEKRVVSAIKNKRTNRLIRRFVLEPNLRKLKKALRGESKATSEKKPWITEVKFYAPILYTWVKKEYEKKKGLRFPLMHKQFEKYPRNLTPMPVAKDVTYCLMNNLWPLNQSVSKDSFYVTYVVGARETFYNIEDIVNFVLDNQEMAWIELVNKFLCMGKPTEFLYHLYFTNKLIILAVKDIEVINEEPLVCRFEVYDNEGGWLTKTLVYRNKTGYNDWWIWRKD